MHPVQSKIEALFTPTGAEIGFSTIHLGSGETIGINPDTLFSTASVFKVPVMVEVFAQATAGKFAMSDRLPMPEAMRTMGSGVMQKLAVGLAPTIRDLAMLMIIISDNTATEMLLSLVGAKNVTATMRRLGLGNINVVLNLAELFAHAYHLPLDPPPGYAEMQAASRERAMDYGSLTFAASDKSTTSSAGDMARLLVMIQQGRAGTAADCADMMTILHAQQLRDRVPRYLPVAAVGNKTGTFRGIRNDAGLITRGESDVMAFALFTFDRTDLPIGNSRQLIERNVLVNSAMAEVGQVLWDHFARA